VSNTEGTRSDLTPPLRLADITALVLRGTLPPGQYLTACLVVRDADFWHRWTGRALLALATGHLLAGVIFFFAFNWAEISTFTKFAVLEGALVAAAVAWWRLGFDSLPGQAMGVAVTVLLGVLMAVFGQVYQTGADAYELFVNWALLSLPFVVAARSWPHWLVWLVLANTAGVTFLEQAPEAPDIGESGYGSLLLFGNLAVLIFIEATRAIFNPNAWFRYIVICAVLVIAVVTGSIGIIGFRSALIEFSWRWSALILPIVLVLAGYGRARFLEPDFAIVTLTTFAFITLVFVAVIRVGVDAFDWDDLGLIAVLGLTAPCLIGLAVLHLRRLWSQRGASS
jgi:uncharacterized membrane protein